MKVLICDLKGEALNYALGKARGIDLEILDNNGDGPVSLIPRGQGAIERRDLP